MQLYKGRAVPGGVKDELSCMKRTCGLNQLNLDLIQFSPLKFGHFIYHF